MRRVVGVLLAAVVWSGASAASAAEKRDAAKPPNDVAAAAADRLVREALAAELAGDNAQRDALLAEALREDPNCRAARWHSGFVSIDGKWFTILDVVQKFSADPNLTAYRRLRDQAADAGLFSRGASDTVAGGTDAPGATAHGASIQTHRPDALSAAGLAAHVDLARWCRNKQLVEEERAHWTQVLVEDSTNSEARSRLGMRMFMGSLMTNAQIEAAKKQHADEEKQLADWKVTVFRWRKALNNGTDADVDRAAHEMEQVNDPAVIPALEWAVLTDAPKVPTQRDLATRFQRQALALLGRLPQQRATYSLTGYSVLSPQRELRGLATEQLKKRPLHDFVPLLLSGLANPIRFDYAMTFNPTLGVADYHAVAAQEGRDSVHQVEYSKTTSGLLPKANGGHFSGSNTSRSVDWLGQQPTKSTTTRYDFTTLAWTPGPTSWSQIPGAIALARQSVNVAASVENQNARIDEMNSRIDAVLKQIKPDETLLGPAKVTEEEQAIPDAALAGSQRGTSSLADRWWNWWADYNELSKPSKQIDLALYATNSDRRYGDNFIIRHSDTDVSHYYNVPPPPPGRHSCFAAGTRVIGSTGPVAIETLRFGDRVLAQDADTGELTFKPVLETTVRPPVEIMRVTTTQGAVRATRGHPFWTVGKGWRMAKELQVGDQVHGLHGSATVTALAQEPPEKAYNLVVADFGTYFVGEGQILVHDNTQRLPSPAILPGFVKAEK